MTAVLVRKLLRDVLVGLCVVALLLFAFQCLWAKVAERIDDILQELLRALGPRVTLAEVLAVVFRGPGRIIEVLMGGLSINLLSPTDRISISYVHPLTQAILCVWAVGRASGAIAGEIDRGTMELLLAQPLARARVILAHLYVDLLTIPVLCLAMWGGTWAGAALVGLLSPGAPALDKVDPFQFAPALLNVAFLVFAVSGYTLWLSSMGRFRWRVTGVAVVLTLVQFLVNVLGQLWEAAGPYRYGTVFYYYQPQPMILRVNWYAQEEVWLRLGVLLGVGVGGYLLALWTFCRRDLPAPL